MKDIKIAIYIIICTVAVYACKTDGKKKLINTPKVNIDTLKQVKETVVIDSVDINPKEGMYVLQFDSISDFNMRRWTIKGKNYDDTIIRNCKFHFSDTKGKQYTFYSTKNTVNIVEGVVDMEVSYALNGYPLDIKDENEKYKGKTFRVSTYSTTISRRKEEKRVQLLNYLSVLENLKPERRNVIEVNPDDDLFTVLLTAQAYDSIYIHSGIYSVSNENEYGFIINTNHISVIGDKGVFLYADTDMTVLDILADDVTIDNLFLAHKEAPSCEGEVVYLGQKTRNITIKNCDINGCGVIGVSFANINENSNYLLENNQIHNNSEAPFYFVKNYFTIEDLNFNGIKCNGNRVWNNGENKIDEPSQYCYTLMFGLSESDKNYISNLITEYSQYEYYSPVSDSVVSLIHNTFEGEYENTETPLYNLNPIDFAGVGAKGILVFDKPKEIIFFDNTYDAIIYFRENIEFESKYFVSKGFTSEGLKPLFETRDTAKMADFKLNIGYDIEYESIAVIEEVKGDATVEISIHSRYDIITNDAKMALLTEYEDFNPKVVFTYNKAGNQVIKKDINDEFIRLPEFSKEKYEIFVHYVDSVIKIKKIPVSKNWLLDFKYAKVGQDNSVETEEVEGFDLKPKFVNADYEYVPQNELGFKTILRYDSITAIYRNKYPESNDWRVEAFDLLKEEKEDRYSWTWGVTNNWGYNATLNANSASALFINLDTDMTFEIDLRFSGVFNYNNYYTSEGDSFSTDNGYWMMADGTIDVKTNDKDLVFPKEMEKGNYLYLIRVLTNGGSEGIEEYYSDLRFLLYN